MDGIIEEKHKRRNNDHDFYEERSEAKFNPETASIKHKVTSLKNFLNVFQKRMVGYEDSTDSNTMIYTGNVLAGNSTVQKLVYLLAPFAENTNLIGDVNKAEYYRKKYRIHSTVNALLLASPDVYAENYSTIMETFKSTFVNIGNVILSSKDLLKGQFISDDREFMESEN